MKKFIVFILLTLSACETCDSSQYQVHSKTTIDSVMCNYEVWALTTCAAWQNRKKINFKDSCTKFQLSQVLTATEVSKYK